MSMEDARGCPAGSEPAELSLTEPVKATVNHALGKIFHSQIYVYDTK